ncbi:hypothetical protein C8R43DRAFT_841893, partial [Mycena crocata]
ATRSATLIGRVGDRISRVVSKYKDARTALTALKGVDFAPQFKELRPSDVNVNPEEESDSKARKKLARLGSSRKARNEPSAKPKVFSWIWTVGGGLGGRAVRVEWCKAKARKDRWVEEVNTLREEMKQVLRILCKIREVWTKRARGRTDVSPELASGLKAYAMRRVDVHRRVADAFHVGW